MVGERGGMDDGGMPMIVIDRVVLGRAVVPEGERSRRPAKTAGEFRPHLMAKEKSEKRRALRLAHALEADRVSDIDVERPAAGFGMRADDRMFGKEVLARLAARARADAIFTRTGDVGLGRAAYADELVEKPAHPVR